MNLEVRDDSLETIEKIEANDPDLCRIAVGFEGFSPRSFKREWEKNPEDDDEKYELLPIEDDSIDWKRLSTAIQRSKVLEELHLGDIEINPDGDDSNFRESDLRALMVAFANSEPQLRKLNLNLISVPFEKLFSEDGSVLQKP